MTLRIKALKIYKEAIVARRLKRLETILDKLGSRETSMNLSRMQDIGGVRAVMKDVSQVYELVGQYTEPGRFSHKLRKPYHDYMAYPKKSGYRGVHLVFEFNNTLSRSEHAREYDGLNIELQLRTELQHAWATAVEAIGLVLREELKSGKGTRQWLEFFALMSSIIARIEDTPVLETHRHMTDRSLQDAAYELIKKLKVQDVMAGWALGLNVVNERNDRGHYVIIELDLAGRRTRLYRYSEKEFGDATEHLAKLEKHATVNKNPAPVLVAVGEIKNLKKAYPNYYLDIGHFLAIVNDVVKTVDDAVK